MYGRWRAHAKRSRVGLRGHLILVEQAARERAAMVGSLPCGSRRSCEVASAERVVPAGHPSRAKAEVAALGVSARCGDDEGFASGAAWKQARSAPRGVAGGGASRESRALAAAGARPSGAPPLTT